MNMNLMQLQNRTMDLLWRYQTEGDSAVDTEEILRFLVDLLEELNRPKP